MAYRTRSQLAELAIKMKNNVDEADQFEMHVDNIIRHCDKKYLLVLIEDMRDIIIQNRKLGETRFECWSDEDIRMMLKESAKILGIEEDPEDKKSY